MTKSKTKPPKKKRTRRSPIPHEVSSARKYAAWEMRVLNPRMTFAQITVKLNEIFPEYPLKSEHQAVEKMIKQAEQEYIEAHQNEVDRIKAESGASLDYVRREAADAWQKSQDLLKIIKKRDNQTIEQILKGTTGEAQYLKLIKETAEAKAKLFGAIEPTKHTVKHSGKLNVDSKVVVYMPSNGRADSEEDEAKPARD